MVPKKWEDIGKEIRCDDNHDWKIWYSRSGTVDDTSIWYVTPCRLVNSYRFLEKNIASIFRVKQSTWCNILEDLKLHQSHRENLKSRFIGLNIYRRFGWACCLHLQGLAFEEDVLVLKTDAVRFSETSVTVFQSTWGNISEVTEHNHWYLITRLV
jgi:hypothetical protein